VARNHVVSVFCALLVLFECSGGSVVSDAVDNPTSRYVSAGKVETEKGKQKSTETNRSVVTRWSRPIRQRL
jgi:hypothetical protein